MSLWLTLASPINGYCAQNNSGANLCYQSFKTTFKFICFVCTCVGVAGACHGSRMKLTGSLLPPCEPLGLISGSQASCCSPSAALPLGFEYLNDGASPAKSLTRVTSLIPKQHNKQMGAVLLSAPGGMGIGWLVDKWVQDGDPESRVHAFHITPKIQLSRGEPKACFHSSTDSL